MGYFHARLAYEAGLFFNAIICGNRTKLSLVGPAKEVTK
jgi:hypothetical protein